MSDAENMSAEEETMDLTAEASLALGDSYYVDENYSAAVDAYAAALTVARDKETALKIRALSHRSAAFGHLGRHEESWEDSQSALAMISSVAGGLRTGEGEMCHKRAGLAAWNLRRYDEAKASFESAAQLACLSNRSDVSYQEWIRQCTEKMEPKKAAAAETKVAPDTKPAAVVDTKPAAQPKAAPAAAPAAASVARRPTMPKYQYYQSSTVMTISILEPNVKREDLKVDFEPKRLTVILTKQGVDFTVIAGNLYSEVDVEKCKIVIKDEKVLLKLRKKEGFDWHELFAKKEIMASSSSPAKAADAPAPAAASKEKARPYASHRNWDEIEKNLEQEEKNEKPVGDEAMNKLFQQIYANADEDTRRAMIKSYQTSGGTVLSTNWGEVAEKDYEKERTAPKGMEWKNWEGDKLPMKDDLDM